MENNSNFLTPHEKGQGDNLNIREELEKYLFHWKWFLLGILITVSYAFIFLKYSTPKYNASTTIMIKDNLKSGISKELSAISDLGIVGKGSVNNTDNEIGIIKSRKIIGQTIDSLNLNISYFIEGRVKNIELYKKSPIKLIPLEKESNFRNLDTLFNVSILNSNSYSFININKETLKTHRFGEVIATKYGSFKMEKVSSIKEYLNLDLFIKVSKKSRVIDSYRSRVIISTINMNSSVLRVSFIDPIKRKAVDFLDELVRQYNIDAINDKNEVSRKTKDFIDDRINSVGKELSSIQDRIKDFKIKTGFTGVSNEGELVLENLSKNTESILLKQTQLTLAKWIQESINNQDGKDVLLPENLGFENISITQSIVKYNELITRKNRLVIIAGEKNPELIELKKEIVNFKLKLKQNLKNLRTSLELQYNQFKKAESKIKSKKSTIPIIERGYIDIARHQGIISGLFSYLLKKKEEIAISLAVTVPKAKIIDVAYSSNSPVSPKRRIIYLTAILLGLLIPFIIIYVKNLLDTKIHSRKDIEELINLPFLGDVPHSEMKGKIAIGEDARSSTAEGFRLIRTNIDFMLLNTSNTELGKTIFITSTISGEGKSFISINLAAALSLFNKKVLLLGMDLRRPKFTEYFGIPERKGITNYITNNDLDLDDVKFSIPEIKGLDIIASGVIPPNPAEILLTDRVKALFEEVRKEYDYIIVDTAPVNLVTDTLLVSKYADIFLYVARANYLDKRMLKIPQTLYNEKKLPNMAIILNDTDIAKGYGYGYGYGYVEKEKKRDIRKIFS